MGLLDTGATVSIISSHVAEYLQLRSASYALLRGVHDTESAPIHIVKVTFRSDFGHMDFVRGVFDTRQRWKQRVLNADRARYPAIWQLANEWYAVFIQHPTVVMAPRMHLGSGCGIEPMGLPDVGYYSYISV